MDDKMANIIWLQNKMIELLTYDNDTILLSQKIIRKYYICSLVTVKFPLTKMTEIKNTCLIKFFVNYLYFVMWQVKV